MRRKKDRKGCPCSIDIRFPNYYPTPEDFYTVHICMLTGKQCPREKWKNYRKCVFYKAAIRMKTKTKPLKFDYRRGDVE